MKSLRAWRAERLMSIRELAGRAGVSTRTIVQLENGRQLATFKTMRRVAAALDVSADDVVEFFEAIQKRGNGPVKPPGTE
jgi:transcriptional regulator with XRE-family HTH domain